MIGGMVYWIGWVRVFASSSQHAVYQWDVSTMYLGGTNAERREMVYFFVGVFRVLLNVDVL